MYTQSGISFERHFPTLSVRFICGGVNSLAVEEVAKAVVLVVLVVVVVEVVDVLVVDVMSCFPSGFCWRRFNRLISPHNLRAE